MTPKEFFKIIYSIRDDVSKAHLFKTARWLTFSEVCTIYTIAQQYPVESYIECGTANGYSATVAAFALLAKGVKNPFVQTFDIVDRSKIWDLPEFSEFKNTVNFVNKSFSENVELPSTPSLIFIDGDHSETGVKQDWKAVKSKMSKKDVVLFHDVSPCEGIAKLIYNIKKSEEYNVTKFYTERGMATVTLR